MANLAYAKGRWINLDKPGGAVFFVGGGTPAYLGIGASDSNDGLTPERPFSTIDGTAGAHAHCVAGRGDTIVVLPGTVTITAAIALDVADVTLTGYTKVPKGCRPPSEITCATDSVEMISIDADNVIVEDLELSNTATTSDTFMIDVSDTASTTGVAIRGCFFDMSGGAATLNGIRFGDGTLYTTRSLIENCVFHDADDIPITISAASDENIVRGCLIVDQASANVMLYGVSCAGDSCLIEGNTISGAGTAGIYLNGTLNMATDNRIWSNGGDTICILAAASATLSTNGNWLTAVAAGNLMDYTGDNTSPSANADVAGVFAADSPAAAFDTPTDDGA